MATVTLDRTGVATDLRIVFSSGTTYLPTAGGALEAHSGTATDYHVSAASSVLLEGTVNRHSFTVPTPSVLPVSLDFVILDIVAHAVVGNGSINLAPGGSEYTEHDLMVADLYTDTSVSPWARVLMKKGTGGIGVGVELLRQSMSKASGAAVSVETHVVGRAVSA
jgi:hypothetical protein